MKDLKLITIPATASVIAPELNDIELLEGQFEFTLIDSTTRKTQDIVKILLTSLESVGAYQQYGSLLPATIGQRKTDALYAQISSSVTSALAYLVAVEPSDAPDEQLASIQSLKVKNGTDARELLISLIVAMQDGSIAQTEFGIKS